MSDLASTLRLDTRLSSVPKEEILRSCDEASARGVTMGDLDKVANDIENLIVAGGMDDKPKDCDGALDEHEAKEDEGLSSVGPTKRIVDVRAFLKTIGDQPVYTRERLEHVAAQLGKARKGEEFELIDFQGEIHPGVSKSGYVYTSSPFPPPNA